jgi:outer membrane protein assembly factor BamB
MWVNSTISNTQGYIATNIPAYDWNVSVNLAGTGWSIGTGGRGLVPLINVGDKLLLIQGTFGGHVGDSGATITTDLANITCISLKPGQIGTTLWTKSYQQAPDNNTRYLSAWDPDNGVFVFTDKESFANYGYSLSNGESLWGPSYPPDTPSVDWNFMIWYTPFCKDGGLYADAFSGLLYCWDDKTGELLWTYGNGGPGNSTSSGLITPYGYYPEFVESIADGKIYLVGNEHSPNSPMYKGSLLRCLNATTGQELWTIFGWGNMMSGTCGPVADGTLTVYNPYSGQIFAYAKGPSSMTVDIANDIVQYGSSIMIKGTITDISAGTQQNEQAARFPQGVPCVSDASQSAWMEYVYMQKPRPTDTTGVLITISVMDSNGNYREIGTTTSTDGFFSLNWKPDITGAYTVYASFAGTDSYWPSHGITSFAVDPAAPTASPYPEVSMPPFEMYIAAAAAAIIVAVAVVGVVVVLALRKRA